MAKADDAVRREGHLNRTYMPVYVPFEALSPVAFVLNFKARLGQTLPFGMYQTCLLSPTTKRFAPPGLIHFYGVGRNHFQERCPKALWMQVEVEITCSRFRGTQQEAWIVDPNNRETRVCKSTAF